MIESGTTIVRVQADIALKLKPNRDGIRDQLRRNARALVVADLAQQRQVKPREAVALVRAARHRGSPAAPAPSPGHRAIPDQLEREVRLDRGTDIGRAAGIDRPAPIGELMVLDVTRATHADRVGFPTQERQQQNVFRLEDRVALELGDPVAFLDAAAPAASRSSARAPDRAFRAASWPVEMSRPEPDHAEGLESSPPSLLAIMRCDSSPSRRGVWSMALPHKTNRRRKKTNLGPQAAHILRAPPRIDQDQTAQ